MTAKKTFTTWELRRRCAANLFKSAVLGDKHVPGNHHTNAMINGMTKAHESASVFEKTWKTWFSTDFRSTPQAKSIEILDEIARDIVPDSSVISSFDLPRHPRFYSELARGGLMSRLIEPTESSDPITTLIGRANEYEPISAFHLHFDALDAAFWFEDCGKTPWVVITAIAANRVLELLFDRWSPRHGLLYKEFASDFSINWDAADDEKRSEIRESCARFTPDLFDHFMRPGARPNWGLVCFSTDISSLHIYKLLFAISADPAFLNERRLPIWSLDLSTAALAMHALAWTDRYNTMATGHPEELYYWSAFHSIYFSLEPLDDFEIGVASALSPARWQDSPIPQFRQASEIYSALLEVCGMTPAEVLETAMTARDEHPLIYK